VGAGHDSDCCTGIADAQGYCAAPGTTSGTGTTGGTTSGTGTTTGGGTTGSAVCGTQRCVVYAHTASDLYIIDPTSLVETHLCSFSGLNGDAYDLAVRADGTVFAVTATDLYSVDATTCAATHLATLGSSSNFNGMTFTLNGHLLAADSAGGNVDEIDTSTGAVSQVGNYGGGLYSSGDLVALSNGKIYATVTDFSGNGDELASVDPTNGYQATVIGNTGFSSIYGLAFWAGTLYGFDSYGDIITIDPSTGVGTLVRNDNVSWYGAGTTPVAPLNR
jgi:hypothetical protein